MWGKSAARISTDAFWLLAVPQLQFLLFLAELWRLSLELVLVSVGCVKSGFANQLSTHGRPVILTGPF